MKSNCPPRKSSGRPGALPGRARLDYLLAGSPAANQRRGGDSNLQPHPTASPLPHRQAFPARCQSALGTRHSAILHGGSVTVWVLLLLMWRPVFAQSLPELHTAAEVRHLTAEQAERHYPVRLRGVLTFFDPSQFFRFFQDDTAGIYVFLSNNSATNHPPFAAGQQVEIEGQTSKGEYAPIVNVRRIQVFGPGQFPAAKAVTFEQLASGQEDSQFVAVHGLVRSVRFEERTRYYQIDIATGGGRLTALAASLPVERSDELVDSTVTVQGACLTRFNGQRQLFDIRLLVPRLEDFIVEQPAPKDPFGIPTQKISSLLQFNPQGFHGHRAKVGGTVIYRFNQGALYIQDQSEGLYVETQQPGWLRVGDQVEVLGFPARGGYTPMLQDARFRKIGFGPAPEPDRITADEALKGTHDCRLVCLEATVLDRAQDSREQFLVLQAGGFIFHAYLEQPGTAAAFEDLQNDSKVAVTGVCRIETGSEWHFGQDWRASSFRLLLRSPADVLVLQAPPWWTLKKLLWMVGLLGVVVLAAFVWVAVLRQRVQQQTRIIGQKLQAEAALKERYVELFENANDMVYSHDLTGHLTAINHAGERLLQRPRAQILTHNFVELIVPEQQGAAQQWLEQVLRGTAAPTTEWDFVVLAEQPLKLEISARLIEQAGQPVEVEGIARDITERKRLEREILEISNREQRRIGHDLHDGVCQQLVGLAYLTESLADRLQEKGATEGAEVERISRLLGHAISQTRGVARGLFPVRLEENGLVSALEELAANASELFQIPCHFACEQAPETVDNSVALHVYYIAQEAVANAAKHGQAKTVRLSLERLRERAVLAVQDDGVGFSLTETHATGMGLRIMHYRARVIGASLEVRSQPGGGTLVTCRFGPLVREGARQSPLKMGGVKV